MFIIIHNKLINKCYFGTFGKHSIFGNGDVSNRKPNLRNCTLDLWPPAQRNNSELSFYSSDMADEDVISISSGEVRQQHYQSTRPRTTPTKQLDRNLYTKDIPTMVVRDHPLSPAIRHIPLKMGSITATD